MCSLILRLISQKGAPGYSLRRIGAPGILSSPNSCCGSKLSGRMISTMSSLNSDESSSTLPSRISPWLMLPPAFDGGDMVYNFYSVAENRVLSVGGGGGDGEEELELPNSNDLKYVGSSHGWLALFNKRNCDLFLSNPLSRRHIKLPPIHTLSIPEPNLRGGFGCVKKVIISGSPDDEDCRATMSFGPEERLAFCCPGCSTEWTPIGALFHEDDDGKFARVYEDFVYSSRQKLLFCITQFGDFESWDLRDPRSPSMDVDELEFDEENDEESSEIKEICRQFKYLVFSEDSNELFLVTRYVMEQMAPDGSYVKPIYLGMYKGYDVSYPYKTIGFDVHKIDWEDGKLSYMERSLDGLAIFVGINHSFAMSTSTTAEFPHQLKPNSIYFTDPKELTPPNWVNRTYGGHDIGIFDYENRTLSPCYYPCDVQTIKRIQPAPMWFTRSHN